jgi:lantibiotic modifying enzyme
MIMHEDVDQLKLIIDRITEVVEKHEKDNVFCNPSYEKGLLGFSIYYSYLAKFKNLPEYYAKAEECFQRGLQSINTEGAMRPFITKTIDFHLSQIGRFIEFASTHSLLDMDSTAYLEQLDSVLFKCMVNKIAYGDLDSGSGAMAAGHYFLARAKRGIDMTKQLSTLIEGINNCAKIDDRGGFYWESPLIYNRVYLGISHGSAMIISFLSSVYKLKIEQDKCRTISAKAISFLKKYYSKTEFKGLFPTKIDDKSEPRQFALCYGDLGIAVALNRSLSMIDDENLLMFTKQLLDDCLTRTREDNLTLDASIYYGASGLAIMFEKLSVETGDSRYLRRAEYWFGQIPGYAIGSNEYLGFRSRLIQDYGTWNLWNVSFGWGLLGIGCSLMQFRDTTLPRLANLTFIT